MLDFSTLLLLPMLIPQSPADDGVMVGPALGHVDHDSAYVWMRADDAGDYTLVLSTPGSKTAFVASATMEHDLCLVWSCDGLAPGVTYRYEVFDGSECIASGPSCLFTTAPHPDEPAQTTLAFGSCASSDAASIWSAIALQGADGLVLLGDTPYIDSRDLAVARRKHREFLQVPELAALLRSTPLWGTWDDHDFGGNDVDGRMSGKANTRQALVEYRAHESFGHDNQGIYTSFRNGPVEVFLIDARWFARAEKTKDNEELWSLLGERQWAWLEDGLRRSTAPFKILATGMIWDDKQNTESDDWGAFPHERERIERFIGDEGISGCVLMGGDIHVSRHLRYPGATERVGYPIDQFIVSPMHTSTIASLNVPHPDLVWSAVEPKVFLMLEADSTMGPPVLTARWIQDTGRGGGRELYRVTRTLDELTAESDED